MARKKETPQVKNERMMRWIGARPNVRLEADDLEVQFGLGHEPFVGTINRWNQEDSAIFGPRLTPIVEGGRLVAVIFNPRDENAHYRDTWAKRHKRRWIGAARRVKSINKQAIADIGRPVQIGNTAILSLPSEAREDVRPVSPSLLRRVLRPGHRVFEPDAV